MKINKIIFLFVLFFLASCHTRFGRAGFFIPIPNEYLIVNNNTGDPFYMIKIPFEIDGQNDYIRVRLPQQLTKGGLDYNLYIQSLGKYIKTNYHDNVFIFFVVYLNDGTSYKTEKKVYNEDMIFDTNFKIRNIKKIILFVEYKNNIKEIPILYKTKTYFYL